MDMDELGAWLRLLLSPRVGPLLARRLLAAFGSPQAIFAATPSALATLVSAREAANLGTPPPDLSVVLERTAAWLAESPRHHVLSLADPRYPVALLDLADPPILLFAQGDLTLLQRPAVAVVGSRHPTPQGADHAQAFSAAFSEVGVVVVSGLARGIDGAAHVGALEGQARQPRAGGGTIAVVGTGPDVVYPKAHAGLAARIAEHGLLLSEFVPGTPPLAAHFPKRNRLVAALSRGTLVVEAAVQSGSLITARLATELGREVLAIPGSIHAPQARGCHALIKQGARLVETAQDVLEELQLQRPVQLLADLVQARGAATADEADAPVDPLLAAMGHDPVSQEALCARTGWGPAELGARLLELELDGHVARLPGQLFQRVARA
ncbi:DNA-protecting protein DprA [Aquabacterium olei]|uniref:DNA-protecting protein DprA n=2 Tax=Aquabacterium olei TaxID=1296669 RepID=A0A2U8FN25_9BURK|nr:DNA-processing protein DprA [Aquabacterium olei]AWI52278.1 DNA-protecting protein DprA [Aquabacterium olei]